MDVGEVFSGPVQVEDSSGEAATGLEACFAPPKLVWEKSRILK